MNGSSEKLIKWLFETKAVRVSPQDKPFWYTSGTIGPYYVNTHFLYGSEKKANELLAVIDTEKKNILSCPSAVLDMAKRNYEDDDIYRGLIDEMCAFIKSRADIHEFDCISGGERRDWFFSLIIADTLKKPHLTIYKSLEAVISASGHVGEADDLSGMKILHIADLITEASSYERAWIPAIRKRKGELKWSFVVVDRKQGGAEFLAGEGIKSFEMVSIDAGLFEKAFSMGLIDKGQYEMIKKYIKNPKETMRDFIMRNPLFLKNALNSDEKTVERARLCVEKNLYDLDEGFVDRENFISLM